MWTVFGLLLIVSFAQAQLEASCAISDEQCLLAARYPKDIVVANGQVLDLNELQDAHRRSAVPEMPEVDLNRADPWFAEHYRALTKGITAIDYSKAGSPLKSVINSDLVLFGEKAFPLATSSSGWVTIAGALYGDGRALVVPRKEYLTLDNTEGMTALFVNAVSWLSNNKASPVVATHLNDKVLKLDSSLTNVSPGQLKDNAVDVYVVSAHTKFSDADVATIVQFVSNGGGIIVGGQAWYWGDGYQKDYYGNKIVTKMGILIDGYDWSRRSSPVEPMLTEDYNIFNAMDTVVAGSASEVAKKTVNGASSICFNAVTMSMPEFAEIFAKAETLWKSLDASKDLTLYSRQTSALLNIFMKKGDFQIPIASNHKSFPYEVPADASPVDKSIDVVASYGGRDSEFWYSGAGKSLKLSTGLYAKAGDLVTVIFPDNVVGQNLQVQIGAHTDSLYKYTDEDLKTRRSPEIVTYFPVDQKEVQVGNPWGGLLYVLVPAGAALGQISVRFQNVYDAPYFVLGKTTNDEWNNVIKNYKGPWAEFEAPGQIILTVPTSEAAKISDPSDLMNVHKEIMEKVNELAGITTRDRTERFVFDKEISGGWMHSGYPMMGYISAVADHINAAKLKKEGTWGYIHEIGHNQQWKSWTLKGTTQTSCNWWSLYVNQRLWDIKWAHGATGAGETETRIHNWVMKGKPKEDWSVWLALDTYTILAEEFGWESYTGLIKKYYDLPHVSNEDEKFDLWARRYSQEVNTNLCPFFEWFQFPLTAETKAICETLPALKKDLLKEYRHPTEHGTCDEGWIPYGDSCFFLSDEKLTWWDAQERCEEVPGASLASCLTEPEAFFLGTQVGSKTTYYFGISDLEKPGTFQNMDGSGVGKMPWKSGKPDNTNAEHCGCYYSGKVEDWFCKRERQFICKKGPTSCKPKDTCPKDWVLWNERCYYFATGGKMFNDAVKACPARNKDSYLVEINSKEEDDFVRQHAEDRRGSGIYYYTNYWLALRDMGQPGAFEWLSGKEVDYMGGWCEGDPDGQGNVYLSAWPASDKYCWEEDDAPRMKAEEICEMAATTAKEAASDAADQP